MDNIISAKRMNGCLRVSCCTIFVILDVFCQTPEAQLQSFVSSIETFIDDVVGAKALESALSRASLSSGKLESDSLVGNVERIISERLVEHASVVNRLKTAMETEVGSGEKVATRECCRDDEVAVPNVVSLRNVANTVGKLQIFHIRLYLEL